MAAPKHQTGFLALWTAFIVFTGIPLLCVAKAEAVIVLWFLLWFVVALTYSLLVSLVRAAKGTGGRAPTTRRAAAVPGVPAPPTTDTELARLKAEHAKRVRVLEATPGLSPDEVRDAKTRLERDLLRAIEALLG